MVAPVRYELLQSSNSMAPGAAHPAVDRRKVRTVRIIAPDLAEILAFCETRLGECADSAE